MDGVVSAPPMEDLERTFRGRRVLVTGDTGFKGGWLVSWLLELGAELHGFALPPEPDAPLFGQLRIASRLDHRDGDLRDAEVVARVFTEVRPEFVFHLAAQALVLRSYAEPKLTFDTNVAGSVNLLEAARGARELKALVFVTSDKCYRNRETEEGYREDDPMGGRDPYSASKAAAEMVFAAYLASFFDGACAPGMASVRAGNVIGGGDRARDRIVPDCVRALEAGEPVALRRPAARRPWQHVLEPLGGYLLLAAGLAEGADLRGTWNLGPDRESVRPVRDLASRVVTAWGADAQDRLVDAPEPDASHEATLLYLESAKARRHLGWRPVWDFETAVERTVDWYRAVDDGADPYAVTVQQIQQYVRDHHD